MSSNGTELPMVFSPGQSLSLMAFEVTERPPSWEEFRRAAHDEGSNPDNGLWPSAGCSFEGCISNPRFRRRAENLVTVCAPGCLAGLGGLFSGYFSTLVTGNLVNAFSIGGGILGGVANSLSTRWSYNDTGPEQILFMLRHLHEDRNRSSQTLEELRARVRALESEVQRLSTAQVHSRDGFDKNPEHEE